MMSAVVTNQGLPKELTFHFQPTILNLAKIHIANKKAYPPFSDLITLRSKRRIFEI